MRSRNILQLFKHLYLWKIHIVYGRKLRKWEWWLLQLYGELEAEWHKAVRQKGRPQEIKRWVREIKK